MALYYILKKIFFFLRMMDREDRKNMKAIQDIHYRKDRKDRKKMKDKKDINYRKDRMDRKNMKDMWT